MRLELIHGDASAWAGDAAGIDLVFTHPYASLPSRLVGKPAIINLYLPPGKEDERISAGEHMVGASLAEISRWGKGLRNRVFVANLEAKKVDTADLVEDEFEPGKGWFPLELPLRLLREYGRSGMAVWDGFMGRGTVGKACQVLGMSYVGMDIDQDRVEIARKYLGVSP